MPLTRTRLLTLCSFLIFALMLAACGGGSASNDAASDGSAASSDAAQSGRTRGAAPTMPAAQFAAPTMIVEITTEPDAATPEAEEPDLELGASAYARLCAECHGDAGEGVADQGDAVIGLDLSEADMTDLLRTGGGYGNEHIFGPSRISEDGIAGLTAFMATLGQD